MISSPPDHRCRNSLRSLRSLILFACSVLGAAVWNPAAADEVADEFSLGVGFYRDQRWELCAETFQRFVTEHPDHPRTGLARVYLGLSLSSLDRYAEGRKQFVEYLRVEPEGANAPDVRYRLGECSYYLKEYDLAVTQLNNYLQKHPGHKLNDWARLFVGDALNELNRPADAENILRAVVNGSASGPLLTDARFRLARSLEAQNKAAEAFDLYRSVSEDTGSDFAPRALARIGSMYFARDRFTDAARVYDDISSRFPGTAAALNARLNSGLALYRAGDFEAALSRLNQIPEDSPLFAQAIVMRALSLRELGRADEAREAFHAALAAAGDSPLAADILFQQARMERAEGNDAVAAQLYEDLTDRWPQDNRFAESLFNAVELRLTGGDAERAGRLWIRLEQDAPDTAGQLRSQTLHGRLLLARAQPVEAVAVLDRALSAATDRESRDSSVAQYYLVRACCDANDFERALSVSATLIPRLDSPELQDLREVLLLAATAALKLDRHSEARTLSDQFLSSAPASPAHAQALATRLIASTHLDDFSTATADAQKLVSNYGEMPGSWETVLLAAQTASDREAWTAAVQLYTVAASENATPESRESGLAGIAWSHFRNGDFKAAQDAFDHAANEFPQSRDVVLLRHMQAVSAEDGQQTEQAARLYAELFNNTTSDDAPVLEDPAKDSPLRFAFDAGRQAARLCEKLGDIDRADALWQSVSKRFPGVSAADAVLDEWAHLNLNHERYPRADEIHRTLLEKFPDSPFAGSARLSLAESRLAAGDVTESLAEFQAILGSAKADAFAKSRATFHLIDIAVARSEWQTAETLGRQFLAEWPQDELIPRVRILLADALLANGAAEEARTLLSEIREGIVQGTVDAEPLTDRVWVLLARAALDLKNYEQIDGLADELFARSPDSRFAFQVRESQGRRWMLQAPPDFPRARDYLKQVVDDPVGRGTRTAANCQLMIADSLRREGTLDEARREYYRLYYAFSGHDDLRAEALYRAAVCEIELKDNDSAARSLQDLLSRFPESPHREEALQALERLNPPATGSGKPGVAGPTS